MINRNPKKHSSKRFFKFFLGGLVVGAECFIGAATLHFMTCEFWKSGPVREFPHAEWACGMWKKQPYPPLKNKNILKLVKFNNIYNIYN